MSSIKTIAVIFGGRSVEHDVSVLSGLQFLEALDPRKYIGLPVYIDPLGQWWTGDSLRLRTAYPLKDKKNKQLTQIWLDLSPDALGRPHFMTREKTLFGTKTGKIDFDIAVPAVHGTNGEDGTLQGLLDFAGIPYAGCRPLGAAAAMDKAFSKQTARSIRLSVLPEYIVQKPIDGQFLDEDVIKKGVQQYLTNHDYPFCVKPVSLGSSVGVSKVDNHDELMAALSSVFRLDSRAIIEPFVENLVEYNVAVRRRSTGEVVTSAIERPSRDADLLDFRNKYLSGNNKKGGSKGCPQSEGMASLNRSLNPKCLTDEQRTKIRVSAIALFDALGLAGSVRVDFLCNEKTGDLYLNEANTIPGSFAYFLWEAANDPISFMELANCMIREAEVYSAQRRVTTDAASSGAVIFD